MAIGLVTRAEWVERGAPRPAVPTWASAVGNHEHGPGPLRRAGAVTSKHESGTAVQDELNAFARSFGVELERTRDTYDSLVRAALAPT